MAKFKTKDHVVSKNMSDNTIYIVNNPDVLPAEFWTTFMTLEGVEGVHNENDYIIMDSVGEIISYAMQGVVMTIALSVVVIGFIAIMVKIFMSCEF